MQQDLQFLRAYKVASFNHFNYSLAEVGKYQLPENDFELLHMLKSKYQIEEIQYLNTCNRVEVLIYSHSFPSTEFPRLFADLYQGDKACTTNFSGLEIYEGKAAAEHWLSIASSLKSLVLGEREILTQCRTSYEKCRKETLCANALGMLTQSAIECGKAVFTNTGVARRSVSVVYLAFKALLEKTGELKGKNILLFGFGQTNQTMLKFLEKQGVKQLNIVNRSKGKITEIVGNKYSSFSLQEFKNGDANAQYDVIIACTSATKALISLDFVSEYLIKSPQSALIDLALPSDFEESIAQDFNTNFIGIESLKAEVEKNLEERKSELKACQVILDDKLEAFTKNYNERLALKAFKDIPSEIAKVKNKAINEIFAKELEGLGANEKQVLENILNYMERRCVAIPMSVAKKVFS